MAEGPETDTRPTDPVGRVLHAIARVLAICGGILLCAMALLTTLSVSGRSAFSMPVPGDFELVAIGTGLAVFAFLPWCQLTRGNVLVDFFMTRAPVRAKTACDVLGGIFYLIIAIVLTWRMIFGGLDMYNYAEKSMTINFPRWTTFPPSILMMAFLVVVIVYTVWRSIQETRAGRYFEDDSGPEG
ncbi:MAG: TRAP transporter small permease [Alphaproteobacteria bacterium]